MYAARVAADLREAEHFATSAACFQAAPPISIERARNPFPVLDLLSERPDAAVLAAVGVPAADVADERTRMRDVRFGRTRNRSLLGTLNDFAFMAQPTDPRRAPPETPEVLMRFLAQTPILPLNGARPIDLTLAAFGIESDPSRRRVVLSNCPAS